MPEAHETYVDWLEVENRAFADAAQLGLDVAVPSCPAWSVEVLVVHHASFQIWITELIVERAQEPVAPREQRPPGRSIEHARDYVAEMFTLLLPNLIRSFGAPLPSGTLALRSTDDRCSWTVRPTATTIEMVADGDAGDASLTGSTSDLFLALWSRASNAHEDGDTSVLKQWRSAIAGT